VFPKIFFYVLLGPQGRSDQYRLGCSSPGSWPGTDYSSMCAVQVWFGTANSSADVGLGVGIGYS
jgi:hypothetical protein